jgi:hypothetical protein
VGSGAIKRAAHVCSIIRLLVQFYSTANMINACGQFLRDKSRLTWLKDLGGVDTT